MKTQVQPKAVVAHKRHGDLLRLYLECGCWEYERYYANRPLPEVSVCRECSGLPCLDPECEGIMVRRYSKVSHSRFYGCSTYTKTGCKKSMGCYAHTLAMKDYLVIDY